MRKRKTKLSNIIMLLLILLVLFYIVIQQKSIKITANELVKEYSTSQRKADVKFLNKDLEVTGEVKSFYEFKNMKSILQLNSENDSVQLYCIVKNKEAEEKARSLTSSTVVTVYGRCLGVNSSMAEKFFPGIYIEVERIK